MTHFEYMEQQGQINIFEIIDVLDEYEFLLTKRSQVQQHDTRHRLSYDSKSPGKQVVAKHA